MIKPLADSRRQRTDLHGSESMPMLHRPGSVGRYRTDLHASTHPENNVKLDAYGRVTDPEHQRYFGRRSSDVNLRHKPPARQVQSVAVGYRHGDIAEVQAEHHHPLAARVAQEQDAVEEINKLSYAPRRRTMLHAAPIDDSFFPREDVLRGNEEHLNTHTVVCEAPFFDRAHTAHGRKSTDIPREGTHMTSIWIDSSLLAA